MESTSTSAASAPASSAASASALTKEQTHALFDILTHHETYAEIEGFKAPDAVTGYGFPFARTTAVGTSNGGGSASGQAGGASRARTPVSFWRVRGRNVDEKSGGEDDKAEDDEAEAQYSSTSPLLQLMLTRLVLPLPGVRDLPPEFWNVRAQGLLARFAEAELSESFDKGAMGTRKTLATGASSVLEMVARGILGGVERAGGEEKKGKANEYDESKAEDLLRAFGDLLEEWAYGDLMERVSEHVTETEDLESFSPAMKAALNYAIINIATFAHHIFTVSPEGQDLLKLIENINTLIPYKMIKQTLRIGNAATMISGMMRLMLAKLSVTGLTNWVGLTASADDGMNLLQRIISLALSWDASEFKKTVDRIEKMKGEGALAEDVLEAVRRHVALPRGEHLAAREASLRDDKSIVVAILEAADEKLVGELTEAQHGLCLEYYAALLSVHDREAITGVLCRQPPDLFTQAVKDVVSAYDPMIRIVHSRIDIRFYLEAVQSFLSDLIRVSKLKRGKSCNKKKDDGDGTASAKEDDDGEADDAGANVEDYVVLLRKHRGMLYKWVHDFARNCPEVWKEFPAWGQAIATRFRKPDSAAAAGGAAGIEGEEIDGAKTCMEERLNELFASLDESAKEGVLRAVDKHAEYLASITELSRRRLQAVIDAAASLSTTDSSTPSRTRDSGGPGIYLSQWQSLLDSTKITPLSKQGPLRHGEDVKYVSPMGKLGLGGRNLKRRTGRNQSGEEEEEEEEMKAPDVSVVVDVLGGAFRDVIRQRGRDIWVD
ncbi:PX-associated domain-containing protein [Trichoderma novae-zelandiae]